MIRPALLLVVALSSRAYAGDCAAQADELRAHLEHAQHNVVLWTTSWAVAYGVASASSFTTVAVKWNPTGTFDQDYKEMATVSGIKAGIGFLSQLLIPLRVPELPVPDADRCVELAALRKTAREVRKREHNTFWLNLLGGTAINLTGAGVLWYRRSLGVGALSFGIGFPVGVVSALTQPRSTWQLVDDEGAKWSAAVVPTDGGAMAILGASF